MPRTSRPRAHLPTGPADRSLVHSQNFLTSRALVERLVERSTVGPDDLVLEIGPGRGIITEALARRAGRVMAVEKDPALAARLRRQFAGCPTVSIVAADCLRVPLPVEPFTVFASIPFNATSEIVSRLLAASCPPIDSYLVVQREAAERHVGGARETLVSVLLKPWFEPSIVHRFRRDDFAPAPRVEVVMLRLRKRGPPLVSGEEAGLFRDVVRYGFTAWRPSLLSSLEGLVGRTRARQLGEQVGLASAAPPSLVPFEVWLGLVQALTAGDRARVKARLSSTARMLRQQQQSLAKIHRTRTRWTRRPPPGQGVGHAPPYRSTFVMSG
jgi:23S rRNA (adenine-N6)-dimethyltransferase